MSALKTKVTNVLDIHLESGVHKDVVITLTPNEGSGPWAMSYTPPPPPPNQCPESFSEIRFLVYPPKRNALVVVNQANAVAREKAAKVAEETTYDEVVQAIEVATGAANAATIVAEGVAAAIASSYACVTLEVNLSGDGWTFCKNNPMVQTDNQYFSQEVAEALASQGISARVCDKQKKLVLELCYVKLADKTVEDISAAVDLAMNFCCEKGDEKYNSPDPRLSIGHGNK